MKNNVEMVSGMQVVHRLMHLAAKTRHEETIVALKYDVKYEVNTNDSISINLSRGKDYIPFLI